MALDQNDLLSLIASDLPDNTSGDITPSDVRTVLSQMVSSSLNNLEATTQTFTGSVTFPSPISSSQVGSNIVMVRAASDLAGVLDSTKIYWIDGIIDMGAQSIQIPAGGISIAGWDFDRSKLTSSSTSYTMFASPGGGSGNVLWRDFAIEVTGATSQVLNITSDTGFEAFEIARVNFNDCTSLGTITNYRQGLEVGTGRFGGTPELTLAGAWVGGYFIDTSIVRSLTDGAYTLFKAGAGFTMASRFRTNMNVDLPASASLLDFAPANFSGSSKLQLSDCILSRAGVFNVFDTNITPNIEASDLESFWRSNVGIRNTYVGGRSTVSSEAATTISDTVSWFAIAGTYTASDLQHFTAPSNGQLRHDGEYPIEFKVTSSLDIDGNANDDISIRIRQWDDSASGFITVATQTRQINSLSGGNDVAFFTIIASAVLGEDDYVFLEVKNNTASNNITLLNDSFFVVEER